MKSIVMVLLAITCISATRAKDTNPETPDPTITAVHFENPIYPPLALTARIQGTVAFDLMIGPDGKVAYINKGNGPAMLYEASEENIKKWIFACAQCEAGRPYPHHFEYHYEIPPWSKEPREDVHICETTLTMNAYSAFVRSPACAIIY